MLVVVAVASITTGAQRISHNTTEIHAVESSRVVATPIPTPTPTPKPTPKPRRYTVASVGTAHSGSSNQFVDPWGCEARHAQQWNPSRKYWGKYQPARGTWAAHGGDPGQYGSAPEAEQDRVAARVKYDAWPNC